MFCNILFTNEVHFKDNEKNTTRNSNILDHDDPYGRVRSEYQYCFSINVWCGIIGESLDLTSSHKVW
jgi:hypothetical protein